MQAQTIEARTHTKKHNTHSTLGPSTDELGASCGLGSKREWMVEGGGGGSVRWCGAEWCVDIAWTGAPLSLFSLSLPLSAHSHTHTHSDARSLALPLPPFQRTLSISLALRSAFTPNFVLSSVVRRLYVHFCHLFRFVFILFFIFSSFLSLPLWISFSRPACISQSVSFIKLDECPTTQIVCFFSSPSHPISFSPVLTPSPEA